MRVQNYKKKSKANRVGNEHAESWNSAGYTCNVMSEKKINRVKKKWKNRMV